MLDVDEASERVPVERRLLVDDDERGGEERRFERRRAAAHGGCVRRGQRLARLVVREAD